MILNIRLRLGVELGHAVSLKEFGGLVASVAGAAKPFAHATATGWEKGAEPGFLAGCAIAHLGGLPAEALAFKQSGGASRPASEVYPQAQPTPFMKVAERGGRAPQKQQRSATAPAKRRGKSA